MGHRVSAAGLVCWYTITDYFESFCTEFTRPPPSSFSLFLVRYQYFPRRYHPKICVEVDHAAEAEVLETVVVGGGEEMIQYEEQEAAYYGSPSHGRRAAMNRNEQQREPAGRVTTPSAANLPSGGQDLDQEGRGANGNDRRRYLRKSSDGDTRNSPQPGRDIEGSTRPAIRSRRKKTAEEHRRRLEREVSEGMEAARIRDPDVDAKDEDVRLLSEYLAASPSEQEEFHERGVRRLGSEETQMPSGRVLTSSTTMDVMVVYTSSAMVSLGTETLMSEDLMETVIINAFATANDALADSGIDAVLNLVHMEQASRPCFGFFSPFVAGIGPT